MAVGVRAFEPSPNSQRKTCGLPPVGVPSKVIGWVGGGLAGGWVTAGVRPPVLPPPLPAMLIPAEPVGQLPLLAVTVLLPAVAQVTVTVEPSPLTVPPPPPHDQVAPGVQLRPLAVKL